MGTAAVEVHGGHDGFRSLLPLWADLLAASGSANIFLTGEWMSSWCDVLGAAVEPWILLVRDDGGTVQGLVPLFRDRRASRSLGLRRLHLMGTGFGADHLTFIARAGADITPEVAGWLSDGARAWDVAELRWLEEEQARRVTAALDRHRGGRQGWALGDADSSPFLRLPARWEEYRMRLGASHRASLGRYARKLERDHRAVAFRRVTAPGEFSRVWNALVRLHQARWRGRGLPGSFVKPRFEELHRRFARAALERDWLRLYFLEVGPEVIAVLYCFRYGPRVSYFQGGFNTAWARYGPGTLLMAHAIRSSIEEGAGEFDFMRGIEEHKLRWKPELRQDYHLTIFRRQPRVLVTLRLQRSVRRFRRRLRLLLARGPQPS